jgi:beta-lactam-binding protein with PASTA domain
MSVASKIATATPLRATPEGPIEGTVKPAAGIVPKVEGLSQEQAARELEKRGFRVGKIDRKESSQNAGTVLDQEPEGGKKAAGGSAVDLEVAVPRGSSIEVPDVVGDNRDRAIQKLRDKRLTVAQPITYQASCEEAGKVLRQDPDEDARVPPGTAVALVVANAGAEPVRVPRLVGVRLADAHRAARDRRIRIGRVERRPTKQYAPDTIFGQSPREDTLVAPDCPVDVVVAVEIQRVAVPNLVEMTFADAQRRLEQAGLRLGRVVPQARGTPNTVLAQDPAPGALVEAGSSVDVSVGQQRQTPPPPPPPDTLVDVPDLKGSMRPAALATLERLGMKVKVAYQDVTPSVRTTRVGPKHDQVIAQSPVGRVRKGTTIQLTVARVQQPIGD